MNDIFFSQNIIPCGWYSHFCWLHPIWYTDWWFGTFLIFPYIGYNHPNWLIIIFQRDWNHQPGYKGAVHRCSSPLPKPHFETQVFEVLLIVAFTAVPCPMNIFAKRGDGINMSKSKLSTTLLQRLLNRTMWLMWLMWLNIGAERWLNRDLLNMLCQDSPLASKQCLLVFSSERLEKKLGRNERMGKVTKVTGTERKTKGSTCFYHVYTIDTLHACT